MGFKKLKSQRSYYILFESDGYFISFVENSPITFYGYLLHSVVMLNGNKVL